MTWEKPWNTTAPADVRTVKDNSRSMHCYLRWPNGKQESAVANDWNSRIQSFAGCRRTILTAQQRDAAYRRETRQQNCSTQMNEIHCWPLRRFQYWIISSKYLFGIGAVVKQPISTKRLGIIFYFYFLCVLEHVKWQTSADVNCHLHGAHDSRPVAIRLQARRAHKPQSFGKMTLTGSSVSFDSIFCCCFDPMFVYWWSVENASTSNVYFPFSTYCLRDTAYMQ